MLPLVENDPGVQWLLQSKDPSVRFLTLTELIGKSAKSKEVADVKNLIPEGPRVRALLRGQKADGGFGGHPYAKWTGAHWRLVSLVELAIPSDLPQAKKAVEQVLAWLTSDDHVRSIKVVEGRARQHASQEGNAIAVCSRLGLTQDARVEQLADRLMENQWPDGGWNCDSKRAASHSSFYESITPLWGLTEYAAATGNTEASAAVERATELFLSHRLFKSSKNGDVINKEWLRLHYPLYWHYDVLHAALILTRADKAKDPRMSNALDVIEGKRLRDGTWRPTGYYWRPPGSSSGLEAVDWGRGRPNEMITLNALRVLKAAGRL